MVALTTLQALPKPEMQKIDRNKIIDSGLDCEFSFDGFTYRARLERSTSMSDGGTGITINRIDYLKYQIRPNYWFYWAGGECPLPKGVRIKFKRRGWITDYAESCNIEEDRIVGWKHIGNGNDIIAFQVIGTVCGWEY